MKRVLLLFLCLAATAAQAGLVLLPGSSPQTVKVGEALLPIRVQLTDDRGMPVRGTSVGYSVPPQAVLAPPVPCPGVGAPCGVFTDDSGIALLPPMIALQPGHWLLSITSGAWPAVFADITIVAPEAPASLEIAAGNDQVLPAGASGMPFVVRVVRNAQPVGCIELCAHFADCATVLLRFLRGPASRHRQHFWRNWPSIPAPRRHTRYLA